MTPEVEFDKRNRPDLSDALLILAVSAAFVALALFVDKTFWSIETRFTDPISGGYRDALEDVGFEIEKADFGADYRDGPIDIASLELDVRGTGCAPEDVSCVREVLAMQPWVASIGPTQSATGVVFEVFDESVGLRCQASTSPGVGRPREGESWTLYIFC